MTEPTPESSSFAGDACLNCGTLLRGPYCIQCGQPARVRSLSLLDLLREFFEEAFDLDSKAWRSLKPLMFQPGRITNEYLAGRRARYISPLRLYVTASVLFFIVAAITDTNVRISWSDYEAERDGIETTEPEGSAAGCDDISLEIEADWGRHYQERVIKACKIVTADNGKSLERAAVDNIPVMMVFFIPVLALVMKLLYPLSKRYYVEHLLFFLHYHSFGFLWLMGTIFVYEGGAALNWPNALWRAVGIASSVYMSAYLYFAMRCVYGQRTFVTGVKFVLLFFSYTIMLTLSLVAVMLYTALTL